MADKTTSTPTQGKPLKPDTYDAVSDLDKNGEPAHLSSQAADPGAFERQRAAEAKRLDGKR